MIRTYARTTTWPGKLFYEWYKVNNNMILIDHGQQVNYRYQLKGVPVYLYHRHIKVPANTVDFVVKWVPGKRIRKLMLLMQYLQYNLTDIDCRLAIGKTMIHALLFMLIPVVLFLIQKLAI